VTCPKYYPALSSQTVQDFPARGKGIQSSDLIGPHEAASLDVGRKNRNQPALSLSYLRHDTPSDRAGRLSRVQGPEHLKIRAARLPLVKTSDVRLGSKADLGAHPSQVRSSPTTDVAERRLDVRFVPGAAVAIHGPAGAAEPSYGASKLHTRVRFPSPAPAISQRVRPTTNHAQRGRATILPEEGRRKARKGLAKRDNFFMLSPARRLSWGPRTR
jgi:hypothetical protein